MRDLVGTNIIKGISVGMDNESTDLNKTAINNMQDLYSSLRGAVDTETARTTATVASNTVINNNSVVNNANDGTNKEITLHNVINLDGRVIAETTAPYMDTQLGNMQSRRERGGV